MHKHHNHIQIIHQQQSAQKYHKTQPYINTQQQYQQTQSYSNNSAAMDQLPQSPHITKPKSEDLTRFYNLPTLPERENGYHMILTDEKDPWIADTFLQGKCPSNIGMYQLSSNLQC